MGRILLVLLILFMFLPAMVLGWLKFGNVPVAVSDPPLPLERQLAGMALNARITRELVLSPPISTDEENLVAGAHIYSEKCAICHGYHGKPSTLGTSIFPYAPQLWDKHSNSDVVGVSDDLPGETYWKVNNGIRLSGMPSFKGVLSENEMWQVSILLSQADKPLPPAALDLLSGELTGPAAAVSAPAKTAPSRGEEDQQ